MCVNSLTKTVTRQRRDCDLGLVEITFSGFSCAKTYQFSFADYWRRVLFYFIWYFDDISLGKLGDTSQQSMQRQKNRHVSFVEINAPRKASSIRHGEHETQMLCS